MKTFLQLNTIFLSMIMEAIPFVLLGVLISGVIQSFITERWISRIMPKKPISCFSFRLQYRHSISFMRVRDRSDHPPSIKQRRPSKCGNCFYVDWTHY